MLLWSLDETARQLGGLSRRTVQRLIHRGELPCIRMGRLVRIPADAVREFVARKIETADNWKRAEPKAWKGAIPCHINAQIRLSGMPVIPTQAARELDVLLKRLNDAKRKH
jgi:excisionase family DNA binding protein